MLMSYQSSRHFRSHPVLHSIESCRGFSLYMSASPAVLQHVLHRVPISLLCLTKLSCLVLGTKDKHSPHTGRKLTSSAVAPVLKKCQHAGFRDAAELVRGYVGCVSSQVVASSHRYGVSYKQMSCRYAMSCRCTKMRAATCVLFENRVQVSGIPLFVFYRSEICGNPTGHQIAIAKLEPSQLEESETDVEV